MGATNLWTTPRRRAVEKFIATAQKRLRLADWTLTCDFAEDIDDAYATITRATDQKRATIKFGAAVFLGSSAADQRQTLVHELLHCHLFDLHDAALAAVAAVDGKAHRRTLKDLVRSQVEIATDALADAAVAMTADLPVPATTAPLRAFEGATATGKATTTTTKTKTKTGAKPGAAPVSDQAAAVPAVVPVAAKSRTRR